MRMRPSAGTRSPASMLTMSPGTSSSIGDLDEGPVAADLGLDDHHLLERGDARVRLALLVQAHGRVEQRQADEHDAGRDLAGRNRLRMPATSSTICIGSRYWRRNACQRGSFGGLGELVRRRTWRGARRLGLRSARARLVDALALERGLVASGRARHGRLGRVAAVDGCRSSRSSASRSLSAAAMQVAVIDRMTEHASGRRSSGSRAGRAPATRT